MEKSLISYRGRSEKYISVILYVLGDVGFLFFKKPYPKSNGGEKMSEAIIAKKAELVKEVAQKIEDASSVVLVDYLGLTVEQVTNLRTQLREANVEFKVLKNGIVRRAVAAANLEGLDEVLVGPTAVAFSNEDAVAPAKILADFAKTADALEIKAGIIEGKVASKGEVEALAALPNRDGMLSMLLSVLQAPVRNTALAVKAVAEQKEEVA